MNNKEKLEAEAQANEQEWRALIGVIDDPRIPSDASTNVDSYLGKAIEQNCLNGLRGRA